MQSSPFTVYCELEAYEKADAPDGQTMRIGGIVSTDDMDLEGERLVQEGMDFAPFLDRGWFNDNHGSSSTDVLGYPTGAKYVKKGGRLPNGKVADRNGWWAEGYLLPTTKGRELWELTRALKGTPRGLGFSVEGGVVARDPKDRKTVARAVVAHVAITHCPVNTHTAMHALSKALSVGSAIASPGAAPGAGFPLRTESLQVSGPINVAAWLAELDKAQGSLTVSKAQARTIVRDRLPHLTEAQISTMIDSI